MEMKKKNRKTDVWSGNNVFLCIYNLSTDIVLRKCISFGLIISGSIMEKEEMGRSALKIEFGEDVLFEKRK